MPDCYDCKQPIAELVVWLGDEWGGKFPFHSDCAAQPWPLFDCDPPVPTPDQRLTYLFKRWGGLLTRLANS